MSLYLPSGLTDPIPAFQLAFGKLKSPVSNVWHRCFVSTYYFVYIIYYYFLE